MNLTIQELLDRLQSLLKRSNITPMSMTNVEDVTEWANRIHLIWGDVSVRDDEIEELRDRNAELKDEVITLKSSDEYRDDEIEELRDENTELKEQIRSLERELENS